MALTLINAWGALWPTRLHWLRALALVNIIETPSDIRFVFSRRARATQNGFNAARAREHRGIFIYPVYEGSGSFSRASILSLSFFRMFDCRGRRRMIFVIRVARVEVSALLDWT